MIVVFLFPSGAKAAFIFEPAEVGTYTTYVSWRDQYRTDFGWPTPSTWVTMRTYFETPTGTPFTTDYAQIDVDSQIMWLTCNGTYQFHFLDSFGAVVYWTGRIVTTAMIAPTCTSYLDGGSRDDLNGKIDDIPGDGFNIGWDDMSGAAEYEIWKDGKLIDTVPNDGNPNQYHIPDPGGSVNIVAKDAAGEYIGHTDLQVPEYTGQEDYGTDPNACDICEKLADALACPDWDTYMGELSDMIGSALDDYLGVVPTIPLVEDIETAIVPDLPVINTSPPPEADFDIAVPADYDTPLIFNITDATPIPVVDGSEPIGILDPDAYLVHDDPGVMVFPGDVRNDSDGIKIPDVIVTGYPMPSPAVPEASIPPANMPTPSTSPGPGPTPGSSPGPGPTPTIP